MRLLGLEKIHDTHLAKQITLLCETAAKSNIYKTDEFSIIPNPAGIHPSFDIYPLAKPQSNKLDHISAILTDMDGTTTTTEVLCLHAQEYMIQKITSQHGKPRVPKLNPEADYPHIIGNSTTKHIEYLMQTYGKFIVEESLVTSYVYAAVWTLLYSPDKGRKNDVTQTLKLLSVEKQIQSAVLHYSGNGPLSDYVATVSGSLPKIMPKEHTVQVKMAIDIYYQRYHEILQRIAEGKAEILANELTHGNRLIEPMNGIAVFLALIKGYLGEELQTLFENPDPKLKQIGNYFEHHPVKIALVTSSIFYEANIVLTEVFKVLQKEVQAWKLSSKRQRAVLKLFENYQHVYEAVVTASDSNEIRLKPHRDLYSIGLYKMGIPVSEFPNALGFEDSESGLLAIRASGIGRALGIPFEATKGHNLHAASTVLHGGLIELITKYHFFLSLP